MTNDFNVEIERYKALSEEINNYINFYFKAIVFYLGIAAVSAKFFFDLKETAYAKPFWLLIQCVNIIAIFCIYLFKATISKVDTNRNKVGKNAGLDPLYVPSFIFHFATLTLVIGIIAWVLVWMIFLKG